MLFLDQPPESYSQRVKPEFNGLLSQMSNLKMHIDSALEEDDLMEFSEVIDRVFEFHKYDVYLLLIHLKTSTTGCFNSICYTLNAY